MTSDHIQILIKMPSSSQEPPASSKFPISTLRIWMFFAPSNSKYWAKIWNIHISKISDHIKIKIKMPNPSQEPPDPTKAPNQNFKDMDVLCTFKIKIESQHSESRCIKDQWLYTNQDQDTNPQPGSSSPHQNSKSGLKGHTSSNQLQNQDWEPKFRSWVYQRPVTISKSRSRCQTWVRNLYHSPKQKMRT